MSENFSIKISVVTVVHNKKTHIEDCIKSVLNQKYEHIEYIIVDGASTDGTCDVIRKYEQRISGWISEPDGGVYDAMNKGLRMASGDVIGFLNADDVYCDDHVLEKVASVLNNSAYDACYSELVYVDENNLNKVIRYWSSREFRSGLFKGGWVPAHPTFFVRKSVYDRYGHFNLRFHLAADFELMARLLEFHKIKAKYVPEITVKMRMGGVTNKSVMNILRQNWEIRRACKINDIRIFFPVFILSKFINRASQFLRRKSF